MQQPFVPSVAESAVAAGVVLNSSQSPGIRTADQKVIESGCIELICKLENTFTKAKSAGKEEFVDNAAAVSHKMLALLRDFGQCHLTGDANTQAQEEIERAQTAAFAYKEVLKRRSWGNAVLRAFCSVEESEEIKIAYARLGEAMIRACATTLYHAVISVGFETKLGKQIDESTVVFVTELKQSW
jgi:hypothetical protein